jgi:hypothetical protein
MGQQPQSRLSSLHVCGPHGQATPVRGSARHSTTPAARAADYRPDNAGRRSLKCRAGRAGSLGRGEPCALLEILRRTAFSARPGPQQLSAT